VHRAGRGLERDRLRRGRACTEQRRNGSLKAGAVTHPKLAAKAVTTSNVLDHSLLGVDFKSGQLPAGPKGDKGDAGAKGDIGPSDAFTTFSTGTPVTVGSGGGTTIISLTLAAGAYFVIGRTELVDSSSGAHIVRCSISPSISGQGLGGTISGAGSIGLTVSDTVHLDASSTVSLVCTNFGGTTKAYARVLDAIKVGTLTSS
jgi:hypothetical protein